MNMNNKASRTGEYGKKISGIVRIAVIAALTLTAFSYYVFGQSPSDYNTYILKYYKTAIRQQKKYKIPASIILAQAILESGAGKSYLATEGNNHFGIKCKPEWTGRCIYKDDNEKKECFRKYASSADSFEDHSLFLANRIYYKPLFKLQPTDYKAWAKGLKECGYATDSLYATKLIKLIDRYKLYYYDTANETDLPLMMPLMTKK